MGSLRALFLLLLFGAAPAHAGGPDFAERVAPILQQHCLRCHSGSEPKGGLSLESAEALRRGGDSGPIIAAGRPDNSLLVEYVSGNEPEMPKDGKPLSAGDVEIIRTWVAAGAPWPSELELVEKKSYDLDWWSLRPLILPPVPTIQSDWIRTPIDAFILAKLVEKKLAPSPEADRRALIRRLYFDLLGLPPSPEEVDAFTADADSRAYEKLVNRLLASPQYGERWGRHWLDVVHYGDTQGYDKDKLRANAWPYRDYVIRAFNDDKPYSRFVREQLAGDVLYPDSADGIVATGFIAAGPFDYVGQIEVAEGTLAKAITRNLDRDDMVAVTIGTFNSMTAHCARCHDHKFDPISQEDYYSLQAVFAGVDRADRPYAENPHEALVFAAATDFKAEGAFQPTGGTPRRVYVLNRGNENDPGKEAAAGACGYIPELNPRFAISNESNEGLRRAALAEWLVDKRNPLTWRSIVNRVWHYHFGRGIVDSPNDFGSMGAPPTHPELLNWLAADFRDGRQSIKELHRLICNSSVYRQSSGNNSEFQRIDSGNQYLWRMNRRKLEAEAVRDSVLSIAGKLDLTQGGPGFHTFGFEDDHSPHYNYDDFDPNDPRTHRRSVYRLIVRSVPDPFMTSLDCADPSAVVAKRNETLTPLQSLAMLNNRFIVRMAEHFAGRLEPLGDDTSERMVAAWRLAFGREPDADELSAVVRYANQYGLPSACRMIFNLNEFVFID